MFKITRKLGVLTGIGYAMLMQSLPCAAQGAQSFPTKPVTIVMPFAAGGMGDTLARLLATHLAAEWKQPVIVENKPGASGMIGNAFVARAKPDGYTLLVAIAQVTQAPALYSKMQYDILKDFTPLSKLANTRAIFATSATSDIKSLKDYVTRAASNPGKYSFGSFGAGTTAHIYGEIFNKHNNIQATHIAYKGSAPLISDMLGGHVSLAFLDMPTALPYTSSGRLKAHAIAGTTRSPSMPDIPTFKELGYDGFETNGWYGVLGPAGMSPDLTKKISDTLRRIVRSPELKAKLVSLGLEPEGTTPEEFRRILQSDLETWTKIIKEGGVTVE
jgi:tripartite-type tricarboxylate transporter receptor subunit TctC